MGVGRTKSAVVIGARAHLVEIAAHVTSGLPHWAMVGLPDTAISEARDRVRAAVASSALQWPTGRITVGLGPASLPKRGSGLDLGIAMAVLVAESPDPDRQRVANWVMVGELDLDGRVRPVGSVLAAAIAARDAGIETLVVPTENGQEAGLVTGLQVVPAVSLRQVWAHVCGDEELAAREAAGHPVVHTEVSELAPHQPDLADVRGQDNAREALVIAAAGGHHMCLMGPAGVGKTMLATRLPSLLPDLDDEEALEATVIRALVNPTAPPGLVRRPPFQAPHHTTTDIALVGGGSGDRPRVGLVTQAHTGVLFLDEAAEFSANALDALRQSLETRQITVTRSGFHIDLPARFQLVLATNPCSCGRALDTSGPPCTCTPNQRRRYLAKLAGPLLDRVDVRLTLRRPTMAELTGLSGGNSTSAAAAARVRAARERSAQRLADTPWSVNAAVPTTVVRSQWPISPDLQTALDRAATTRESIRGLALCLRLAWTLADLRGSDTPTVADLDTAMELRDAQGWAA